MFDGFNDDDEDAFFAPLSASSSNLASLFDVPMNTSASAPTIVYTALTYTAPKQPSKGKTEDRKDAPRKPKGSSVVIKFEEVQAFKLVEDAQSAQGKCGLALIGNETIHIYQLLLYKHKSDIICTAKVNNLFQFTTLRDNYAIYCDNEKQNWTVLFNTEAAQDAFTSAIESKGGVIVNNKAAPEQTFPKHEQSTATFVTVNAVKDKSGTVAKADILSRMAKVGQQLLPANTKSSDDASSDNENDKLVQKTRKNRKSVSATSSSIAVKNEVTPPSAKTTTEQQYVVVNGQLCPVLQTAPCAPAIPLNSQTILPTDGSTAIYSPNQITPEKLAMYFIENRTHNSEVRMNIMRLTNKMEEMMEKVNKIDVSNSSMTDYSLKETQKDMDITLKIEIKNLEKEICDLKSKREIDANLNMDLSRRITNLLDEIDQQKRAIEKYAKKETSYMEQLHSLETKIKEQLIKSENYEQDNTDFLAIDPTKMLWITGTVKTIMNSLYQDVNSELRDDISLNKDLRKMVAQKIKDTTYNIIAAVKELEIVD